MPPRQAGGAAGGDGGAVEVRALTIIVPNSRSISWALMILAYHGHYTKFADYVCSELCLCLGNLYLGRPVNSSLQSFVNGQQDTLQWLPEVRLTIMIRHTE